MREAEGVRLPGGRMTSGLVRHGDPLPDLPERLRLFVDAYGLTDRARIVPALQRAPLADAERVSYWPVSAAGVAGKLEFLAGQLRWIHGISASLARAL